MTHAYTPHAPSLAIPVPLPVVPAPVRASMSHPIRTVASTDLLGSDVELSIDHHGVMYRLRVTSLGKLILTK